MSTLAAFKKRIINHHKNKNMQDPNAKQQAEETAQEAAAEATTDTANSEAGEATDTEAGGE